MKVLQLSDFCETGSGGTPSRSRQSAYYDGGTIPWVKSGELSRSVVDFAEEFITEQGLSDSSAKLLQPGAILIAMYGATVGQVSRLAIPAATNQAICHIYPEKTICLPDYLYRVLKGAKDRLLAKRVGGGQPNISQKIVRGLRVPLPPLAQLDALLQSTFLAMFGGEGVSKSIGELLSDGALKLHKDGNHGGRYPRAHEFGESGIPFLSAKCISEDGTFLQTEIQFLNEQKARTLKLGWIEDGDVLLAHNASVGKAFHYHGEFDEALIGTSLTAFRPNPGVLDSAYLLGALRSQGFQQQLFANMGQTTRNQVPITAQRRLSIPLPPVERQHRFAAIVQSVELQKALERAVGGHGTQPNHAGGGLFGAAVHLGQHLAAVLGQFADQVGAVIQGDLRGGIDHCIDMTLVAFVSLPTSWRPQA